VERAAAAVTQRSSLEVRREQSHDAIHVVRWTRPALTEPLPAEGRIVVAALVFFAGGVAILSAATREPGDALTCAGQCGAGSEPIAGEASIFLPNGSQAAVVGSESARALAARKDAVS
jgi:hypothetical protein